MGAPFSPSRCDFLGDECRKNASPRTPGQATSIISLVGIDERWSIQVGGEVATLSSNPVWFFVFFWACYFASSLRG